MLRLLNNFRVFNRTLFSKLFHHRKMTDPATLQKLEDGFKKLQDAKDCKSLLKKHLTKERFDQLKGLKTAMGKWILFIIYPLLSSKGVTWARRFFYQFKFRRSNKDLLSNHQVRPFWTAFKAVSITFLLRFAKLRLSACFFKSEKCSISVLDIENLMNLKTLQIRLWSFLAFRTSKT